MSQFPFIMIKPSHYDDDGYVIQWAYSWVPSNSLATIYGLAQDCKDRKVLGESVNLELLALDETNTRIKPEEIIPGKSTAILSSSSAEKPDPDISEAFKLTSFFVKGCVKIISGAGSIFCLLLR